MNKIRHYFSTLELTRGLGIALLSSAFIYLNHWGFSYALLNTFLGLLSLYLLLQSNTKTWFISGTLMGLFWFWWIVLSLIHYEMLWAVPIEILIIILSYGSLFAFISWVSIKITSYIHQDGQPCSLSLRRSDARRKHYVSGSSAPRLTAAQSARVSPRHLGR